MSKIYVLRDTEAGCFIDSFHTLEEAQDAVSEYESEDIRLGIYSPNFYEITEEELNAAGHE